MVIGDSGLHRIIFKDNIVYFVIAVAVTTDEIIAVVLVLVLVSLIVV